MGGHKENPKRGRKGKEERQRRSLPSRLSPQGNDAHSKMLPHPLLLWSPFPALHRPCVSLPMTAHAQLLLPQGLCTGVLLAWNAFPLGLSLAVPFSSSLCLCVC